MSWTCGCCVLRAAPLPAQCVGHPASWPGPVPVPPRYSHVLLLFSRIEACTSPLLCPCLCLQCLPPLRQRPSGAGGLVRQHGNTAGAAPLGSYGWEVLPGRNFGASYKAFMLWLCYCNVIECRFSVYRLSRWPAARIFASHAYPGTIGHGQVGQDLPGLWNGMYFSIMSLHTC